MTDLRQWAILVCTAAIICTLLQRLFPSGSLGNQGRLLLPCVFLCVVLTPLIGMDWQSKAQLSFEPPSLESEAITSRMQQQLIQQTNETLLAMVNQALERYDVQAKKVVTDMDIKEDGSIHMEQITVYVDKKTAVRSIMVKQVAEQRLGTTVTVAQLEEHE